MEQGLSFQQLHDDEGLALELFDPMDRADVGMIQRRSGLRFALEALERNRIRGQLLRQELEGDKAAQLEVFALVNHPHATTADDLEHAVVRDFLADETGTPGRGRRPGRLTE